jgi:hypothetical protein
VSLAGCGTGDRVADASPRTGPTIARTRDSAVFTVDCELSHQGQDDPIVHPGHPGMSHPHDFFGNTTTDADSTGRTLLGQPTTCEDREDTAAYWSPSIVDGEGFVRPILLRAYYRAAPGADAATVRVPPLGLQLLAGDMHTPPGAHSPVSRVGWGCGLRPKRWRASPPQDCTDRSPLTLHLTFPDCWDGEHVRSADHRAHAAYSVDGRCPSSQPVPILQVETATQYPITGSTKELRLASGGWQTSHGDFLNAWDPERLRRHTELCIRALANCTIG